MAGEGKEPFPQKKVGRVADTIGKSSCAGRGVGYSLDTIFIGDKGQRH